MSKTRKNISQKYWKKKTFSQEVRQKIIAKCGGKCVKCRQVGTEIHHLVPNTILNSKIYGSDNIQSVENGVLVCHSCHDNHSLWDKELRKSLIKKWITSTISNEHL